MAGRIDGLSLATVPCSVLPGFTQSGICAFREHRRCDSHPRRWPAASAGTYLWRSTPAAGFLLAWQGCSEFGMPN